MATWSSPSARLVWVSGRGRELPRNCSLRARVRKDLLVVTPVTLQNHACHRMTGVCTQSSSGTSNAQAPSAER